MIGGDGEDKYYIKKISFDGKVIKGQGIDNHSDWSVHSYFLGYTPFPGTLNIASNGCPFSNYEDNQIIQPYNNANIAFFSNRSLLLPGLINNYKCHIPITRPIKNKADFHVISEFHLRKLLSLNNNDIVNIDLFILLKETKEKI